jgi:signal transduction histidine kinase
VSTIAFAAVSGWILCFNRGINNKVNGTIMTISAINDDNRKNKEIARYKQFLTWTFLAAFFFGVMMLLAYELYDEPLIGFAGAVALGYATCLLAAGALLRRGRIYAAVMLSSIGLLVVTFLLPFSLSIAVPAISILPLLAIAHALPYLPSREIRLLINAAWSFAVIVISYNIFYPTPMALPDWFSSAFRISSFGAALGIIFLLLWQYATRLTAMLEQTRAVNTKLETQAAQLKAANEELKQFASIVSHDLRAPLLNIRGFSKELRLAFKDAGITPGQSNVKLGSEQIQALSDALEDDIPEALEFIDSSVTRMDGFLNALLKLSRLGRRELQFETIDTEDLVSETLKTLGYKIETDGVEIKAAPLPRVYADRISFEQIFGNILSNAVNYLDPSRPGRVFINAASHTDEIIFSIQDNGRGIAQEDHEKIFAPLRRAGRQDVPGEGMGLAYVQTLVRMHRGKIWFESQPNVGTTFFFTLSRSLTGEANNE